MKRSFIRKRISRELYRKLSHIPMMRIDNNAKGYYLKKLLAEYKVPFTSLGSGTNRYGILIDGYAWKFALDDAGRIDNMREFKFGGKLYPDCIKAYEVDYYGLIEVTEYVEVMDINTFYEYKNEMREILERISSAFLIGDIGLIGKNHKNWGLRHTADGVEVCMLDYAYIYDIKSSVFQCSCRRGTIHYTEDFSSFMCPVCRRRFMFGEIHQKLTPDIQKREIGDLRELGYVLSSEVADIPTDSRFVFGAPAVKQKKKISPSVQRILDQEAEERFAAACLEGEVDPFV